MTAVLDPAVFARAADLCDPPPPNPAHGYFPDARTKQCPPDGDWLIWLLLAGRGFGKTATGSEWLVDEALATRGDYALAAPTFGDARGICVEGPSGLIVTLKRRQIEYRWNPSLGEIKFPNGSRIKLGSADEPDRFRGWNFSGAWCDELAAWRYPDSWTQIRLATRIGVRPRILITTTPRPVALVRDLVKRDDGTVAVVRGSTWENADNLSPEVLVELRRRYEGTRVGRQELEGEILDDIEGALWSLNLIDAHRVSQEFVDGYGDGFGEGSELVVALDPAVSSGDESDESGIIVAASTPPGSCPKCGSAVDPSGMPVRHFFVLDDVSGRLSAAETMQQVVASYHYHEANKVVVERNNGGDYLPSTIRAIDPQVPVETVWATRGKSLRAEPVAALYEQGKVHHGGGFPELEDQMCTWTPDGRTSPDRLDALVWAIRWLDREPGVSNRWQVVDSGVE